MSESKPAQPQQKVTIQSNDNVVLEVGMLYPANPSRPNKPPDQASLTIPI